MARITPKGTMGSIWRVKNHDLPGDSDKYPKSWEMINMRLDRKITSVAPRDCALRDGKPEEDAHFPVLSLLSGTLNMPCYA